MTSASGIRDRAANDLGLLRLGQALQDQDKTRIESAYDEVYAQLKNEGLATWASTADVPDDLVPHVVALVAQNCLSTYGVSNDRYTRITNSSSSALREIRKLVAQNTSDQCEAVDY